MAVSCAVTSGAVFQTSVTVLRRGRWVGAGLLDALPYVGHAEAEGCEVEEAA